MRTIGLYLIELDGVERSFHDWRKDAAATHLADDAAQLSEAIDGARTRNAGAVVSRAIATAITPCLGICCLRGERVGALVPATPLR